MAELFTSAIEGLKMVWREGVLDIWLMYTGAITIGVIVGWLLRGALKPKSEGD